MGSSAALGRGSGLLLGPDDLLVTLCRAAGSPPGSARLGARAGAGARLDRGPPGDSGWIPVDATTAWTGVSADYLPLFGPDERPDGPPLPRHARLVLRVP